MRARAEPLTAAAYAVVAVAPVVPCQGTGARSPLVSPAARAAAAGSGGGADVQAAAPADRDQGEGSAERHPSCGAGSDLLRRHTDILTHAGDNRASAPSIRSRAASRMVGVVA